MTRKPTCDTCGGLARHLPGCPEADEPEEPMPAEASRTVELYVLWTDRTWTSVPVEVRGRPDDIADEAECERLARSALDYKRGSDIEVIGPLYHMGEMECDADEADSRPAAGLETA